MTFISIIGIPREGCDVQDVADHISGMWRGLRIHSRQIYGEQGIPSIGWEWHASSVLARHFG